MSSDEMKVLIDNINSLYNLGLYIGDIKTSAWISRFTNLDFKLANTMVSLYYSNRETDSYRREIRPEDIFTMRSLAVSKVGEYTSNECGYCNGAKMINVKRFVNKVGFIDYAYGCLCNNSSTLEKITKEMINDFQQIQKVPARYVDVYIYNGNVKTGDLITNDLVNSVKTKRYSHDAIERFKQKHLLEIEKGAKYEKGKGFSVV